MGGERVEPHSPLDPRNGALRITQECQVDAALNDKARIIWIERQRAFQMVLAFGKLSLEQRDAAHDAMALRVVLIDTHRPFDHLDRLLEAFRGSSLEFFCQRREAWVHLDRAIEVNIGLTVSIRSFKVMAIFAAQ